jgi:hypothetical protein
LLLSAVADVVAVVVVVVVVVMVVVVIVVDWPNRYHATRFRSLCSFLAHCSL